MLRGGLGRAERGDDVVIIAVTRLLADSIGEDLRASSNYANLCSSVRLIDRHKLRLSIMHGLGSICGINNDENDLLDVSDVRVWLEKLPMAMTKRVEVSLTKSLDELQPRAFSDTCAERRARSPCALAFVWSSRRF